MNRLKAEEAIEFVENMASLYFEGRNVSGLVRSMEEDTSWIGTGPGEISRNLTEAAHTLAADVKEYEGNFVINSSEYTFVPLSETTGVVYGTLIAIPFDSAISEDHMRMSMVLKKTKDGIKLVHMHSSHADRDQERGSFFVKKAVAKDNQSLRQTLDMKERQLANLTKNIPGGAHQCANDSEMTLLSMSDGFLDMFGYEREEIQTLFDGKFLNMVYPCDREGMIKGTREQLKCGPDLELEYRVMCKNGSPVWVLDKGRLIEDGNGGFCFYCLLLEITERKYQQEELRLSLERHQVIMDQTTDIIFEWDIRRDTLNFSSNFRKKFGYDGIAQKISNRIPLSENLHPEDKDVFVNLMRNTASGTAYSETEFRIKNAAGKYLWCRIRATAQFDAEEHPIKAVGVIIDIDAEKKQKQVLLDQAQRDALTGLYNKMAVQTLAEQRMHEKGASGYQALLIVDVDYFKKVNDTYGHLCGDSVLFDVAAVLKERTRATDLVGRIGGDEFLVYLPEVADKEAACQKTKLLLDALQLIRPQSGAPPITCSIGLAVFPRCSVDYHTICKCADRALYQRKNNGRCGASVFDGDIMFDEV